MSIQERVQCQQATTCCLDGAQLRSSSPFSRQQLSPCTIKRLFPALVWMVESKPLCLLFVPLGISQSACEGGCSLPKREPREMKLYHTLRSNYPAWLPGREDSLQPHVRAGCLLLLLISVYIPGPLAEAANAHSSGLALCANGPL